MPSMIFLVLHDMSQFSEILAVWHDAGAPAITVLEGLGTRNLKEQGYRDDLPMMPTVRDLLQADDVPRTTIFSVVPDEIVDLIVERTEELMGDLSEPGKGILFVLPVSRVSGLRAPDADASPE